MELRLGLGSAPVLSGKVVRPTALSSLRHVVRKSTGSIRAVGARHSANGNYRPASGGLAIDMTGLTGMVGKPERIDDPNLRRVAPANTNFETDRAVTFKAGTTVKEATRALAKHGLAFETLASSGRVTLGGLAANATHGTGYRRPSTIASQILRKSVVRTDGEIETIDDSQRLPYARTGLGSLGVDGELTFRAVPAYNLKLSDRRQPEAEGRKQLAAFVEGSDHPTVLWWPSEKRMAFRSLDRTTEEARARRQTLVALIVHLQRPATRILSWMGPLGPRTLNAVTSRASGSEEVDASFKMFEQPEFSSDMHHSIAIPYENLMPAMDSIRELWRARGYVHHYPIVMRFVDGEGTPLSPAQGGRHVYIEMYGQACFKGGEAALGDAAQNLIDRYGGRAHWSKGTYRDPRANYFPREVMEKFDELRGQLDPQGRLMSEWTQRELDGEPRGCAGKE
ncbi:MAG: D-arabinono-1,4-lactone oxidase [Solirubrobacterales bacterium]|jgi:FAD/FMN-containing dehydrogenase